MVSKLQISSSTWSSISDWDFLKNQYDVRIGDFQWERIVENAPPPYRTAFLVLLGTGIRSAELTHMQWADMDFRQNVIHVREKTWSKNGETQTWRPKTGDQRAIPMTPQVKAELQKLPHRNVWVFLAPASAKYPTGNHRLTETRLLKALKPVLKKLSLYGHVHKFRHTFISVALTNGIPQATVRAWVGHVDDSNPHYS